MASIQESLPPQLHGYAPSKAEKDAYQYLFERADTQQLGVLTGDLAVPFFSHSGLPPLLLGEVWQIADPDNSGFLSPDRFGVACRLIGHAQQRNRAGAPEVKPEWVTKAGPLPSFNKYPIPARLQQLADESLRSSSSSSPAPGGPAPSSPAQPSRQSSLAPPAPAAAGLTTISPTDKANYARAFAGANGGQVAGLLDGDKAREIWVKTQLPYDVLGQVWNLADTHLRGALDLTDFTIGMHLLHLVLDGSLPASSIPTVLDPKLYAAAAGLPAPGTGAGPTSPQQQQQQQQPTQGPQSPLRQASLPAAQQQRQPQQPQQQQQGPAWAITPAELADSNTWFDSLDSQSGRKGHIDGEQAVGFFGQSGLGVDQLAKVWDLADVQNAGHLTRETFAVAMHLLKRALSSPNTPLPDTLPTELVPPSMRQQQQQQQHQPSGPQRDLLDLLDEDDDAPSSAQPPVQAMQPQRTGTLSPQTTGQQPLAPMRAMSPQLTGQQQYPQRAMSPQLTGQGQRALSPQPTGGSASYTLRGTVFSQPTGSGFGAGAASSSGSGFESNFAPGQSSQQQQPPQQAPRAAAAAATSSSFFDDNDDADLAASASALSAQEDSLRREASTLESQQGQSGKTRAELETQVEASNREVAALQERISTARAAHEAELVRVDELRTRLKDGSALKERAKADLIRAESDLSALRMEKSELEGEVLRDKEEVRDLKRRVGIVEEEKRILRAEIDKAKKEVRQGKGLAAIARKQLSQGETDRGTLERELDDARNPPLAPEPAPVAAPPSSFAAALPSPSSTSIDAAAEAALARTAPTAAAAHAAAVPLPGTPAGAAALSPAASSVRSMNPFDRLIGSGGVSPQHTGSSPSASKNPFAFASAPAPQQQQAAPAQEGQTLSRDAAPASFGDSTERNEADKDEASTSLPLAAAAAVGTGALAALGAAGAGIAHALGVGSDEDGDKDKEVDSKRESVEADPFGVPTSGASAAAPAQASFDDGFGDDFAATSSSAAPVPGAFTSTDDDAFGDDFAASAPPVSAAVVDEQDASGFDDEFAALDAAEGAVPASSSSAVAPTETDHERVPAPVEGTLGEIEPEAGFTDAVRDLDEHHLGPDAVQGTLADVEPNAGFDEAFREVEEGESAAPVVDKGKARAVDDDAADEGDVFGESAAAPLDGDDVESDRGGASTLSDTSDDEDDGPEEAFGAPATRPRSRSGASSPDASGFATPVGATSTTDLGASTTSEIAAVTGESSSAPRDLEDGTGPTSELAARREHEPTTNSESGESFVHVNVGPTGTAESEHMLEPQAPASFEPASPAVSPSPGAGSSTRRAAPPPPQRSANAAALTPPEVPAFPPAAAVDNGFADAFVVPSSASTAPAPTASAEDDFDSAFAGLSNSSAASPFPASSSEPTTAAPPAAQPLFDSFDSEFDDFGGGAENAARTASDSAKVNSAVGASSDFDDAAFADFDSSFPETGTTGTASSTAQVPAQQGGSLDDDDAAFARFDDAFATTPIPGSTTAMDAGPPQLGAPIGVSSTTAAAPSSVNSTPSYAPPPGPPPPLAAPPSAVRTPSVDEFAGDTDEVRTIRQMGFSKQEALDALEKYDGDVNRAVNSLVG